MGTPRAWHPERVATACELLSQGKSPMQVACEVGATKQAVVGLVDRLRRAGDERLPENWRNVQTRNRSPAEPPVPATRVDRPTFPCPRCAAPGYCGHGDRVRPWGIAA